MKFKGLFKVRHFGKDGKLKGKYRVPNAIVNIGKIEILDIMFGATAKSPTWYFGLIDNVGFSALAATDVMLLHPGWDKFTDYSNANRPEWDEAVAALDGPDVKMKTTTEATFNINQDGSAIKGLFITDSNTVGGTTGILWSTALFGSVKNLDNGDTLKVTYEITVG